MAMVQESHFDDIIPNDIIPNGGQIVERFGGIRPMASKMNVPVTTVQGWKKRDAIPAIRRDEILNAARRYDVQVKDLIGESANENTPGIVSIEEDPALTRAASVPAPDSILTGSPVSHRAQSAQLNERAHVAQAHAQPQRKADAMSSPVQPQKQQPQVTPKRDAITGIDMREVKKSARRTSLITTTCLAVLAIGAGYLLFGQGNTGSAGRINALDSRVTALEQRPQAQDSGALKTLQDQVNNITAVIGSSAEGLAQLAREVAAGTNAPLTQRLAVLEAQLQSGAGANAAPAISNLTNRMEAMAASPQGQAEWQSAINDLRNTVNGLSGRSDQVDAALADARTQNDALGRTLSQVSGNDVGAAAMLLALTQLRSSVDRHTPFQQDLETLKGVSNADPALAQSLDKLAPYAQTGIMSPAALKAALQASASDIITAKLRGEDVSMKEKIMLHLKSLFSIRKDGMADGSGSEHDLIQTASRQLDAGDVSGAMATLQQLQGPAAQAAQPWQQQAQGTLIAQNVDTDLVSAIVTKIKSGVALATAPAAHGLTGVVNAGPINMGGSSSSVTPSLAPAPAQADAQAAQPEATQPQAGAITAPIQQTPPPQSMAPMEQQNVPGVVIPQTQAQPQASQYPALPQTEPQAGNTGDATGTIETAPALVAPDSGVTIQQ